MAEGHKHNPVEHVIDHGSLELPGVLVQLPFFDVGTVRFQLTRLMVMELIAALVIAALFIPLARHMAREQVTRGRFLNLLEVMVVFVRDQVGRAAMGGHAADKFLPYLLTAFFFVLINNLMGLFPGGASATANMNVTGVLAVTTFGIVLVCGIRESGFVGFWLNLVPKLDVPILLKVPLWGLMFVVEVASLFIRHIVLAVRLWANMFVGHIILAVLLGFIVAAGSLLARGLIAPVAIGLSLPMNALELFVACLQAYIFTFLSALFIGQAVHPHH